ncbi:unnamed protein product [Phytophthora fragariaefolia]|uniref:Unnamed protein product n=1 Tax=Phytophthora fragariaefolia TaxID=1490495 RepID=A0A9W7CTJ4_9STRA|nr:unnamed protein product [Phytophthora fragariaefolia]
MNTTRSSSRRYGRMKLAWFANYVVVSTASNRQLLCGFAQFGTSFAVMDSFNALQTPSTPRVESLKLHVNSYVGREGEPLLRWLVEVDTAITARRIVDPLSKVAFVMSCLGGRARGWAYRRRLTDPTCFSTYELFKEELRQPFEPPQNEFRSRAEFLDLQQGKHDVYAYAQRARYLVSNFVTYPIDEATKVVTFTKGLRGGSVKTYIFREYPSTLEAAITLAMQEEFSLRQAKLHVNAPRPMPRPVMKPSGGPEPMDPRVRQLLVPSSVVDQRMSVVSTVTTPVSAQRLSTRPRADVTIPDSAPSESHSHCKKKDDKPNLVILKVNSKRERSLRALVDCGASNNFVRLQSLARLDFEDVKLPRSLLEVRLATGVVVRTEKRVVRVCFSYEEKKFVDELIVLDWAKRTVVRFRSSGATESDGTVGAAHAPRGAYDPPAEAARGAAASDLSARTLTTKRVVREKCEPNQKPQIRSDLIDSRGVKSVVIVSTVVDTQGEQEEPVTKESDLGASAPGADAIGPNIKDAPPSAVEGKEARQPREPMLQGVRTVANVPHRKCLRARMQPGCRKKRYTIKPGVIACVRGMRRRSDERSVHGRAWTEEHTRNRVPHEK